jgi:alpha-beta hydrolase superfamily lysophospholipase
MGSFLARDYITKYSQGLAGCILSGTAGPSPLYAVLNRLAKFIGKRKGERSEAAFISKVSGDTYLKRIEHPSGKWAWLSTVDEVCEKYDADPYSGFTFTNKGYEDLFALMVAIGRKDWPARVPKQLPLFIFSGSEDPVGDYGKGIVELAKRLREVDIDDVTVTLYPGGRHEMLNEANKDEVYSDVLAWLDGRV